jgi:hypothetical protein
VEPASDEAAPVLVPVSSSPAVVPGSVVLAGPLLLPLLPEPSPETFG